MRTTMNDNGQGEGQRSWWEKPDADPAPQDPYRSGEQPGGGTDAHDPYRTGSSGSSGSSGEAPTQARPTSGAAPTEGLPRYGGSSDQQPYGQQSPYGQPQYSRPQSYAPQQNEQYPAAGSYGGYQPQYDQQYPGYGGPRVTGMAHAVCWTAVGGLVLMGTGLGWVAAIVALALTPGARREIVESGGTKRGLGYLLAGKICAWVNIGLTVLVVLGLIAVFAIGIGGGFDSGSSFDSNTDTVSVLLHR
ncbi:hypothetical protein AB2L27_13145 [Kineococcus sp. LSe6-4]|uniref:DUF4190 domain-containing protein n=1 Tax=Kineococcus halophytocola TaxID=3234027 RepID=A0ABV4H299_9ACTN